MNAPPTNERFQFSIGAMLIYTFGMAAFVSMLTCESLGTVFAAWLVLGLFFFVRKEKGCMKILASGIAWFLLLGFLGGGGTDAPTALMLSLKISGIVSFVAYHFFLLIRNADTT
jgi:hypothetical protein